MKGFRMGLEILISYYIVKKDFPNVLNAENDTLKNILIKKINENAQTISLNEHLRKKVIHLNNYLPGLY